MERNNEALTVITEDAVAIESGSVAALVRSEVEAQLAAAKRYPRNMTQALENARAITSDPDIAQSCIYVIQRTGSNGEKTSIPGPSVRCAEVCLNTYKNLHVSRRIVAIEPDAVVAQGICWDLENNVRSGVEVRRSIRDKRGRRFSNDMIQVTAAAAAAIAARNAVFSVLPRSFVNAVYESARVAAVGTAKTFIDKRAKLMDRLTKLGLTTDRILKRVGRATVDEVDPSDMELLIALGSSIRTGELDIDAAFPVDAPKDHGTLDLSRFKAGSEPNRGHGDERMSEAIRKEAEAIQKEAEADDTVLEDLRASLELCGEEDFLDFQTAANDAGVRMSDVLTHITSTMGYMQPTDLIKARKSEVLRWISAHSKKRGTP